MRGTGLESGAAVVRTVPLDGASLALDDVAAVLRGEEVRLRIPREGYSNEKLWERLRAAARKVGAGRTFPDALDVAIQDDHLPFLEEGVPSIDLIDFDFDCFHETCDDLSVVSERSLDAEDAKVVG